MATVLSEVQPFARVEVQPPRRAKTRGSLLRCLVLSEGPRRRQMLCRSAEESGWDTVVCHDAGQAEIEAQRFRFQLAILDLAATGGVAPEGFRQLGERLARDSGPLLMICGQDDDTLEEIWARQLGAWLYLPGVDDTCDVAMLCREALKAAGKLHPNLSSAEVGSTYAA